MQNATLPIPILQVFTGKKIAVIHVSVHVLKMVMLFEVALYFNQSLDLKVIVLIYSSVPSKTCLREHMTQW